MKHDEALTPADQEILAALRFVRGARTAVDELLPKLRALSLELRRTVDVLAPNRVAGPTAAEKIAALRFYEAHDPSV